MSFATRSVSVGGRSGLATALTLGLAALACAAEPVPRPAGLEPRVPVGKCASADGTLLASSRPGQGYHAVPNGEPVYSRDLLLALPGMRAALTAHGVRLDLWGNLPELSGSPALESAVLLHDSRAFDLDFTLARGRVVVTNRKEQGPARVWLRLPGEAWQLSLAEPGSAFALESFGRWPRGVPFSRERRPGEGPTEVVELTVLKGQVDLKTEDQQVSLSAPPGPAYYRWDSVAGAEGPERRDRLPAWADPKDPSSEARAAVAELARAAAGRLKDRGADAVLRDLLAESARETGKGRAALLRSFAVFGLGAVDEVGRVAEALADPGHEGTRDTAVLALRHWIGVAPGRDQRLHQLLIERQGYRPGQADAVLHLLHSPFAPDLPETYETLIAYLQHGKLAVRELAWWHLTRLAGRGDVRYDPAGPPEERARACAALKKLLADGKLPPKK
jgi:hypothetical protein